MIIVDGKKIYQSIIEKVKRSIEELKKNGFTNPPKLSIIAIGEDKEMEIYIRNKKKAAELCGIEIEIVSLPQNVSQKELEEKIVEKNKSDSCAIIVQLPLPSHIEKTVLEKISPEKDVDCLTSENLGMVMKNPRSARFIPCACLAMLDVFESYNISVIGKHAVVVGASDLVGKPCAVTLTNLGATVTVCHKYTQNLEKFVKEADIVVSAVGKPHLIKGEWIKKGAIVIDIGTKVINGKITGDVEFEKAKEKAYLITPVPGGIGIITVAELMRNVVKAYYITVGKNFPYSISAIGSPSVTELPSET